MKRMNVDVPLKYLYVVYVIPCDINVPFGDGLYHSILDIVVILKGLFIVFIGYTVYMILYMAIHMVILPSRRGS